MKSTVAALVLLGACTVNAQSMRGLVTRNNANPAHLAPEPFDPSTLLFTFLVQDYEPCGSYGDKLAVCASKDFICRMETGQEMVAAEPQCLPIDLDTQDRATEMELALIAPWDACDAAHANPVCRFQFQCMQNNLCMPPDAVPAYYTNDNDAAKVSVCGDQVCNEGQYCQWQETGEQRCAPKPYYQ